MSDPQRGNTYMTSARGGGKGVVDDSMPLVPKVDKGRGSKPQNFGDVMYVHPQSETI